MEKQFTFYVAITGTGKTVDEAWASAQESFVQSNIQTPEVVGEETTPDQIIIGSLMKLGACAIDMGDVDQPVVSDPNNGIRKTLVEVMIEKNQALAEKISQIPTDPSRQSVLLFTNVMEEVVQLQGGILTLIKCQPIGGK